eukprot:TRINITY_DN249_c0_g1_i1.p2 TRINITY_DN249_c0_g1~~TRINITY_DN249_c0_g1_i1.p2  ORF type:complete len:382 (+),score=94.62 TRINITY_DN249_c0_g1_i1:62-1147(+)
MATAQQQGQQGQQPQLIEQSKDVRLADYKTHFDSGDQASKQKRAAKYTHVINTFYDLVTDFYEYGWGQSFHFAPRSKQETFGESIARHEYYLALRLNLLPGHKVVDMGCGIGGPLRNIVRFSGAYVYGINNNDHQIQRGRQLVLQAGLEGKCEFVKSDFMHLPFENDSMDAVFAVEATCHAPDRVACYSEAFRVLKPGGRYAVYEWVMTDKYDPKNPKHVEVKEGIEIGNALPPILHHTEVVRAMEKAGFVVEEESDLDEQRKEFPIPWYDSLEGGLTTLTGFRRSNIGRFCTQQFTNWGERFRVLPKGTSEVSALLNNAADMLVLGGRLGIFTPVMFVVSRKPETKGAAAASSSSVIKPE